MPLPPQGNPGSPDWMPRWCRPGQDLAIYRTGRSPPRSRHRQGRGAGRASCKHAAVPAGFLHGREKHQPPGSTQRRSEAHPTYPRLHFIQPTRHSGRSGPQNPGTLPAGVSLLPPCSPAREPSPPRSPARELSPPCSPAREPSPPRSPAWEPLQHGNCLPCGLQPRNRPPHALRHRNRLPHALQHRNLSPTLSGTGSVSPTLSRTGTIFGYRALGFAEKSEVWRVPVNYTCLIKKEQTLK